MARTISWSEFRKALKTNGRVVFAPSRTSAGSMVYLDLPRCEESDKRGLWEVIAAPSPTVFPRCPQFDLEYNGKWVRGYTTFFRSCEKIRDPMGNKIFNRREVEKIIPDAYQRFDSKKFKRDVYLRNRPQEEKDYDKVKGAFKPIAGNGDPVGTRKSGKTIYSMA